MNMARWKLVLAGGIISLLTEASEYCNLTIQYYDADRIACLDRCGSDNELRCRVDEVCSSTVPWGVRVQPPACMDQCPMLCGHGRYCNHDQHRCLPCSSLCSAYDKSACRVFCYDFFKVLPLRFADPRDCESTQYFDNNRRVCLDKCGADNATKCQVDQFCSSKITWSTHYDPPVCVTHCNELCDGDTYCDHISHSCMPCDTLCSGPDRHACQIHCNERFVMTTTAFTPLSKVESTSLDAVPVYHPTTFSQSNNTERPSILMIICIILAVILFLSLSVNLYLGNKMLRNTKKNEPTSIDEDTAPIVKQRSSKSSADSGVSELWRQTSAM